jgi:hypothetical protein
MVKVLAALKVTLLKTAVRGLMVKLLVSNITVPEPWLNVPPEMVKVLPQYIVAEVEVKVPPLKAKVPFTSILALPPWNVPAAKEAFWVPIVIVRVFWSIVTAFPLASCIPPMLIFPTRVQVPVPELRLNMAISAVPGTVAPPPPPDEVDQ